MPSSIINTFICVVIGGGVYIGILLLMKDEQIFEVIGMFRKKLNKKNS